MPNYRSIRYRNAVETTREDSEFSSVLSGGGVSTLADMDALIAKTGMATGDQAFVQSNNKLYLYNGTGWYLVATVENAQPTTISGVESSYSLASDGTATVITAISTDPEGFPLTWSYAVTTGSLGSTATVSQADNVFTITPSTDEANAGEFSITFSVTDGANGVVSAVSAFTLSFGWTVDLSNVSYDSVSFSTANETDVPYDIIFNDDGTKMYVAGLNDRYCFQYSLSTAFDLSTASYDSVNFDPTVQGTWPIAIRFNADGTKMFILSFQEKYVFQYSLSTAYNIGTASYDSVSFNFTSQGQPFCINFNADGTKMYMIENINDSVHQYSLSTGFDLSTASYDNVSFSVRSQESNPTGFFFNSDGTKMYTTGTNSDSVHQYSLSTGFDLSTASYDSVSFSVNSQEDFTNAVIFNADGTKMYITGEGTATVYQYSTGL